MQPHQLKNWQHQHDYSLAHKQGEQKTRYVMILTFIVMIVEIVAGTMYGSMALLADGWHMGTHAAAFGITLFAYRYARIHENDPSFSFGTGKVTVLGGFASAIALAAVALMMILESIQRLFAPHVIQFNEAIIVAILGLLVNLISAILLDDGSHHNHHHNHGHHDHNLKSAYFHVLADALTSILAIIALFIGKIWGWLWVDALMGIVGAIIIIFWAYRLLRESSCILLDQNTDQDLTHRIRTIIENDPDTCVSDLHIWKVSAGHTAVILSIVTHNPQLPIYYKELLDNINELAHISVEVNKV